MNCQFSILFIPANELLKRFRTRYQEIVRMTLSSKSASPSEIFETVDISQAWCIWPCEQSNVRVRPTLFPTLILRQIKCRYVFFLKKNLEMSQKRS